MRVCARCARLCLCWWTFVHGIHLHYYSEFCSTYWRFMMDDTVVACIHFDAHTHRSSSIWHLAISLRAVHHPYSQFIFSILSQRVCARCFFWSRPENLSFHISIIYFVYLILDVERQRERERGGGVRGEREGHMPGPIRRPFDVQCA